MATQYRTAGNAPESGERDKKGGIYLHPETGHRLIAITHPKFGSSQADAYVRAGFKFERDATADEMAGREPLKQAKVVKYAYVDEDVEQPEVEDEKVEEPESQYPDRPIGTWNKALLTQKAGELGIEIEEGTTNAEIVKLIQEKQK